MDKWKAGILQGIGALLQTGAATLLVIAGNEGALAAAVLGAAAGAGGLFLWGAGARERAQEGRGRAATAEQLEQLEQQLFALQDEVSYLIEERNAALQSPTPVP